MSDWQADGVPVSPYETDRMLNTYLLFHFGAAEEILPYDFGPVSALNFPARVVSEMLDRAALPPAARALDLGCAVGRSSFELAGHCGEVVGIDRSARFVDAARAIGAGQALRYLRMDEGERTTTLTAAWPDRAGAARVRFEVGDACDLRSDLGSFDVVLMANLIDRLPDPARCLSRLPALVRPGGQLIIASPYTWLAEYTPRERWLGGRDRPTLDVLRERLAPDFEWDGARDLPFLIREHARRFQWTVSQGTRWRRRLHRG